MKLDFVPAEAPSSAVVTPPLPKDTKSIAAAAAAIEKEFARRCPQSLLLSERANKVFPGGVTHDNRRVSGPSHFVRKAKGARKTDYDGHSYIDYWVGHGALMLGHTRQEIVEAVHLAAQEMTHPGACHEREVTWAEHIKSMVPTAQRIRFTASGSESSALAIRLARGMTGKQKIVKFEGHFHGWLDHAVPAVDLPFDAPFSAGVPEEIQAFTVVLPARDLDLVESCLKKDKDIAGIILEPTGASGGTVPIRPEFLKGLRELTQKHKTALIFDEVITGFRLAPGGAQERFNVMPDLTCLAKIVAGGLPGGAVCGSEEAFAAMEFSGDAKYDRKHRIAQYGTFNSNPLTAAAGTAMLRIIKHVGACEHAETYCDKLRNGLNTLFRRENLDWGAYGVSSVFHILTSDAQYGRAIRDRQIEAADVPAAALKQKGTLDGILRRALLLEGVDLPPGRQAWVSAAHGVDELTETLDAFQRAIAMLRSHGAI